MERHLAYYTLVDSLTETVFGISQQLHEQAVVKRRICGFMSDQIDRNTMVQHLLALEAQVDIQTLQLPEERMDPDNSESLHHAASVLFELPLFLAKPDAPTVRELLKDAQQMREAEHIDIIFIDTAGISEFTGEAREDALTALKKQLHTAGFQET